MLRAIRLTLLAILLLALAPLAAGAKNDKGRKSRSSSPIKHVVLLMMENRSFDHFLGWVPGADGKQAGLAYPDRTGGMRSTYPLAPDYQGCGHPDPDHSYEGGRVEYDGGKCDGWLLAGTNDEYAIGYYTRNDLAFFSRAIPDWTTGDRYFAAIMAETWPNRIYQHSADTDRLHADPRLCTLPTIWDRLAAKGRSGRYYYSDLPFIALWGPKYVPISRNVTQFFLDAAAGTLPDVSYVEPRFVDEGSGTSGDDHPHADIRNGQVFMNAVYTAVVSSPQWDSTVLVINYDEWGGFFDHVPPPTRPIPPAQRAAGDTDGRLGFRLPLLVVSPWSRPHYVSHTEFDHNSVLKMIEEAFDLQPLTVRDASANSLASALDFSQRRVGQGETQLYQIPPGPYGSVCGPRPAAAVPSGEMGKLYRIAVQNGYPVYGF